MDLERGLVVRTRNVDSIEPFFQGLHSQRSLSKNVWAKLMLLTLENIPMSWQKSIIIHFVDTHTRLAVNLLLERSSLPLFVFYEWDGLPRKQKISSFCITRTRIIILTELYRMIKVGLHLLFCCCCIIIIKRVFCTFCTPSKSASGWVTSGPDVNGQKHRRSVGRSIAYYYSKKKIDDDVFFVSFQTDPSLETISISSLIQLL